MREVERLQVLLTGGAGSIGSHTAVELLRFGHDVAVIDNLSNSNRKSLRQVEEISWRSVELYEVDLTVVARTRTVFENIHINAVVHSATTKRIWSRHSFF